MIDLRSRTIFQFGFLFLLSLLLVACGGNGTYSPTSGTVTPVTQTVGISVNPPTASTTPGGTVQFKAIVTGTTNTAVTWSVLTSGGGTISATGLYTAPSEAVADTKQPSIKPRVGQVVTVQVVSQADSTKSATATVTISSVSSGITISPSPAATYPGGTVQFTAVVSGETSQSVTWSILNSGEGTISATGLYTAPFDDELKKTGIVKRDNSSVTIQAVSVANPKLIATTTVTVADLVVTVSPQNPTVVEGQTLQFSATVTGGTTNHEVSWFGDDGGGTINQTTGLLTAGYKPGVYQILAYSVAQNGDEGYTDFTVVAPKGITVSVTPQNTSVPTGGTIQFKATVGGTTDQNVTWAITNTSYVGSLSSTGLYTAPATGSLQQPFKITVSATSEADPTKVATSSFTVQPPN